MTHLEFLVGLFLGIWIGLLLPTVLGFSRYTKEDLELLEECRDYMEKVRSKWNEWRGPSEKDV